MLIRLLAWLLVRANAQPPSGGREAFYRMKDAPLRRYGHLAGTEWQHIRKVCYACGGDGEADDGGRCWKCSRPGSAPGHLLWLQQSGPPLAGVACSVARAYWGSLASADYPPGRRAPRLECATAPLAPGWLASPSRCPSAVGSAPSPRPSRADPDSPSLASPLQERTPEMRTPPSSIRPGPHFRPLRDNRQGPPLPWRFSCAPCPPGSFPHVPHPVSACRIARLGGHMGFVKRGKGIAWRRARRPDLQGDFESASWTAACGRWPPTPMMPTAASPTPPRSRSPSILPTTWWPRR